MHECYGVCACGYLFIIRRQLCNEPFQSTLQHPNWNIPNIEKFTTLGLQLLQSMSDQLVSRNICQHQSASDIEGCVESKQIFPACILWPTSPRQNSLDRLAVICIFQSGFKVFHRIGGDDLLQRILSLAVLLDEVDGHLEKKKPTDVSEALVGGFKWKFRSSSRL